MKHILTILSITALAFLSCCDPFNPEPQLPPITMEGKNTFGCRINGKVWLPDGSSFIPAVHATYYEPALKRNLVFSARNVNDGSGFSFDLNKPILIDNDYQLNDTSKVNALHTEKINGTLCIYREYHVIEGVLRILVFDLQKGIVAGTFEYTTHNPVCGEKLSITEGRFDMTVTF